MDVTAELDADCPPEVLFEWVEDLGRYPSWLDIVPRAEPVRRTGEQPAWSVDLRGRLGPLARSKRLRMVRTVHQPPSTAVFERLELDGRSHAPWVLRAEVAALGPGPRRGPQPADDAPPLRRRALGPGAGAGARRRDRTFPAAACCAGSTVTVPAAERYGARWDGSATELRVQAPTA